MSHDGGRFAEALVVPMVIGMKVRDDEAVAQAYGLKLAQSDPDGPPLAALISPDVSWVATQSPGPGTRMWRWDSIVIKWSNETDGGAGVREPRRPLPPDNTLAAELPLPSHNCGRRLV